MILLLQDYVNKVVVTTASIKNSNKKISLVELISSKITITYFKNSNAKYSTCIIEITTII